MFNQDPICKSYKGSNFVLGGVLVLVRGWFRRKVGKVFGGGGVGFGQKTGAVLGECRDAFGSCLQWKKVWV